MGSSGGPESPRIIRNTNICFIPPSGRGKDSYPTVTTNLHARSLNCPTPKLRESGRARSRRLAPFPRARRIESHPSRQPFLPQTPLPRAAWPAQSSQPLAAAGPLSPPQLEAGARTAPRLTRCDRSSPCTRSRKTPPPASDPAPNSS